MQATKALTTSTEFNRWRHYFDQRPNDFDPLFWYLAQIACEVRRTRMEHPARVQTKDFILTFTDGREPLHTPQNKQDTIQRSKNFWFAAVLTARTPPQKQLPGPQVAPGSQTALVPQPKPPANRRPRARPPKHRRPR